jgi:hypothetical protein
MIQSGNAIFESDAETARLLVQSDPQVIVEVNEDRDCPIRLAPRRFDKATPLAI